MKTSETTAAIFEALSKAQGEFHNVTRDMVADTGTYTYSYADLGCCLDAVRAPLAAHGLAVIQTAGLTDGEVRVSTVITHASGEWIDCGEISMVPQRPGPQAIGSCITYARRYAMAAALGLAQTDDDAQSAEVAPGTKSAAPTKSMHAAIALIDEIPAGDYDLFKVTWGSLDAAVRAEISKRKPKQLEIWKAKFTGKTDASQDQERTISGDVDESRAESIDVRG